VDASGHCQALVVVDHRRPFDGLTVLVHVLVVAVLLAQIALERNKHELHALAVLCDFADPLRLDVFQGVLRVNLVVEVSDEPRERI
jgi:hypothetical protein